MQPKEVNQKQRNKMTEEKNEKKNTDETKKEESKQENKIETKEKKETPSETKELKKKAEAKKQKETPKKDFVIVNAYSLHLSTKKAAAVCKFINGKEIQEAIKDLERVIVLKKPVPMKGEIPHRKGKIMSGRFPKKTAENFIRLLKSLSANANFVGIQNPRISEAIANIAPRPYGKFGAVRRKRTHVKLVARNLKNNQDKESKTKTKEKK